MNDEILVALLSKNEFVLKVHNLGNSSVHSTISWDYSGNQNKLLLALTWQHSQWLKCKNSLTLQLLAQCGQNMSIFKMWFSFEMRFHFQKVRGFVIFVFPFSFFRKTQQHNCKQTALHSLQIALLMRLWTNNKTYMKLLNLFQLSRIYNSLHPKH